MDDNTNNLIKSKLLYLAEIFFKYTDEKHYLSTSMLLDKMMEIGIETTRQTITLDIALLVEFGYDIVCRRTRVNEYALINRDFEIPELKFLTDIVQTSHFLTPKKTKELTAKIEALASREQAKYLHNRYITSIKTNNEKILINVDRIYKAIYYKYKISFKYLKYTMNKTKVAQRNGEAYTVSPYHLLYKNDNYYLVAYHPRYSSIVTFRVDKISNIKVLKENPALPCPPSFNPDRYSSKIFDMFSGNSKDIELKFDLSLADIVIDKFGSDIRMKRFDETHFTINTSVEISPKFYSWLFGLGQKVTILEPAEVRDEFACQLKKLLNYVTQDIVQEVPTEDSVLQEQIAQIPQAQGDC